jgi:hypothetical protein
MVVNEIMKLIENEDEAIHLYHALAQHFGWQGTFWTFEDVESVWQDCYADQQIPMPLDVWEEVQNNWYWRRGLVERMSEAGSDLVYEAVREVVEGK